MDLTFTSAGTQVDTLTSGAGCDSLATLNLTSVATLAAVVPQILLFVMINFHILGMD